MTRDSRNFPHILSDDEAREWERWRGGRVIAQMSEFTKALQRLAMRNLNENQQFILQELQLWAESILPTDEEEMAES
jgi:exonuclease I